MTEEFWSKRREEIQLTFNNCGFDGYPFKIFTDKLILQEKAMLKQTDLKIIELEKLLTYHKRLNNLRDDK